MAFTKATFDYLDSGGLIKWITTAKTAAFTAVSGEGYLVDTSSAAITVTLPASPSAGDEIIIVDYASNAGTNNITLGRNSLKIRGGTDDLVLSTNNQTARLLYSGATKGWLVTTEAGAVAAALPDLTVDYLVVAGGGGGAAYFGGGAGAGGLRTSYGSTSGGGASAESSLSLLTATNYTVTVGAGATGGVDKDTQAPNGSNSVFSTITSTGGGGSASGGGGTVSAAQDGGSGGGGGSSSQSAGGSAVTSPVVQGYAGGSSGFLAPNYPSAGGGGASQVGASPANASVTNGGNGGDGLSVSITGSAVSYAGGGGGAIGFYTPGSGGSGGGGTGAVGGSAGDTTTVATNGSPNTGGGGGGGSTVTTSSPTGSTGTGGGSGIVIVRYPDAYDITVGSGLTTGQLNTTVGSGEKYTTFTAGTGTITFAEA